MDVEELLQRYAAGEPDFSGVNLNAGRRNCNLFPLENATHISRDAIIASLQTTYFALLLAFLRVIAPRQKEVVN